MYFSEWVLPPNGLTVIAAIDSALKPSVRSCISLFEVELKKTSRWTFRMFDHPDSSLVLMSLFFVQCLEVEVEAEVGLKLPAGLQHKGWGDYQSNDILT